MDLKQDIFIIPSAKSEYIVYSPLRACAFSANTKAADIVKKYIAEDILSNVEKESKVWEYIKELEKRKVNTPIKSSINTTSGAVIILSQICNLACSYCYSQESRSKEILSIEKLKTVIDHVLSQTNEHIKKFSFIGGGEPTATWNSLEWAINYIYNAKNENQKTSISITTNATLLSDERIEFLKKNDVHIGISFDILPPVKWRL